MQGTTLERPTVTTEKNNPEFGALVKRLVAGRAHAHMGRLAGISSTYVGLMIQGDIPGYDILSKLADGLAKEAPFISAEDRAALFRLAGYDDWSLAATDTRDANAFAEDCRHQLRQRYGEEAGLASSFQQFDPAKPRGEVLAIMARDEREIRRRLELPEEGGIFT